MPLFRQKSRTIVPMAFTLVVLAAAAQFTAAQGDDFVGVFSAGLSPFQLGLLNAIGGCGFFLSVPLANLIHSCGRKTAVVSLFGASSTIALVNYSLWVNGLLTLLPLLVGSLVFVMAKVSFDLAVDTWWPQLVGTEKAGAMFARANAASSAIPLVGPLAIGGLATIAPAAAILLVAAFFCAAVALTSYLLRDDEEKTTGLPDEKTHQDTSSIWSSFRFIVQHRVIAAATCASAVSNASYAFLYGFEFYYLAQVAGLSPLWIGAIFAGQQGLSMVTSAVVGTVGERWSPVTHLVFATTVLLSSAAFAGFASADIEARWWAVLAATLLFTPGFTLVGLVNYSATVALIPERERVLVQGARVSLVMGLVPVALLASAWLAENVGFGVAVGVWAVLLVVTTVLSNALRVRVVRGAATGEAS